MAWLYTRRTLCVYCHVNVTVSPTAAVIVRGSGIGIVQVSGWFVAMGGEGGGGDTRTTGGGGEGGGDDLGGGDGSGGDGDGDALPAGGKTVMAILCPAPQWPATSQMK